MMENLEVFISKSLFFGLTSLREVKQGISCNISLSLAIIDFKMVLKKLLSLADLTRTQILYIHELAEVIMVSKDKDFKFAVFQVKAPSFENLSNSPELLIISFVSSLSGNHFSKKNATRYL